MQGLTSTHPSGLTGSSLLCGQLSRATVTAQQLPLLDSLTPLSEHLKVFVIHLCPHITHKKCPQ